MNENINQLSLKALDIAITGSHIVWEVEDIYWTDYPYYPKYFYYLNMKDVVTGATWDSDFIAGADQKARKCPHISELYPGFGYVVYQGWTGQYWNIYLYHTAIQAEFRVTNMAANQLVPRVSDGRIVYMDNRNGNWDIYMTMVGYGAGTPPPPTPGAAIQQIQGIQSIIADPAQIPTSDIDGAKSKVKENRREALLNKLDAVIVRIQAAADSTHPAGRKANYRSAIRRLNSILDKTDGCALRGKPDTTRTHFTPDWIITCPSQELIDPLIRDSITMLQTFLQQS